MANSSEIEALSRRSISRSKSRNDRFSWAASASPATVFPDPGKPTRIKCGFPTSVSETICDVRKIAVIVSPHFPEGVASELLDRRLCQDKGRHRLGDDAHS